MNYVNSSSNLQVPHNFNGGKTILEVNNAPMTNIIVQQFEVCSHNTNPFVPGSYHPPGYPPFNKSRELGYSDNNTSLYPPQQQGHLNYSSNCYSSFNNGIQTNFNSGLNHSHNLDNSSASVIAKPQYSSNISDSTPKQINSHNYVQQQIRIPVKNNTPYNSHPPPLTPGFSGYFGIDKTNLNDGNSNYNLDSEKNYKFSEHYLESNKVLHSRKNLQSDHFQNNQYPSSNLESKCQDSLNLYSSESKRSNNNRAKEKNKHDKSQPRRSRSLSPIASTYRSVSTSNSSRRYRSPSRSSHRTSVSSKRSSSPRKKSQRSLSPRGTKYSPNNMKSSSRISDGASDKSLKNDKDSVNGKWRSNSCSSGWEDKQFDVEAALEREKSVWTRTAPADLHYQAQQSSLNLVHGTDILSKLCDEFQEELLTKSEKIRSELPKYEPLQRKKRIPLGKHKGHHGCGGGGGGGKSSSSSSSSSESEESDHDDCTTEELEHKKNHPLRLHPELWFNDPGEMNDGPLCRCSARARRSGIRHNIYAGEKLLSPCDPNSNNADKLFHYRITISPPTNFLVKTPTIIEHDSHEYIFEGFSMFSHKKLDALPLCKVIRFNIEYTIVYFEEKFPQNFTIRELDIFFKYLFKELLELVDLDLRAHEDTDGCPQYHFMPRFVRELPKNGKEILSMNEVLSYLLQNYCPLISEDCINDILEMPQHDWQRFTESIKGMIVTYPGKKPCSLRVDQLDRDAEAKAERNNYPEIVHFGIRPPQLSYAGNTEYQKAWREYVKFRHLLANMPKPSFEDKRKLEAKEIRLQNMRTKNELKRNVTVTVSSENFYKTGIMCDVVQHAMLIPVLVCHLRFHRSLDVLEEKIGYTFKNRYIVQLALTHPSYKENFGTNPDHARNSLTNCGIRQPVYGDRRIHYMNTRKRGINTLINIMSRFGKTEETESNITHNERLEFLGDAVVEFVTSVHLFHMFPDLEEGGLATYRAAIVQNQHLAVLAKTLGLEEYMLYAHGSDLCRDLELRHAMANCFEALMGALFLDGGIEVADKVFGKALFKEDDVLLNVWVNLPPHPLQEQEPLGDRKWIKCFPLLQKLAKFEESIGVEFHHIRLLARAFTDRSIGYTNLTLGSNQRLEFLGDTVLQLIASEYLYKYFPEHHEGHLSLLRSSLVNNRTQSVVCNDLGMTTYAVYSNPKAELKTKDRADLLEAFLGALYVDKGLEYCQTFCSVCFFPRLQDFIMHQDWNDPKSKLQQCCLTLRTMEGGEPEIPVYKVIECMGPTNTRIYTVAVYFKGKRLAEASGHSIQQAEMNAAKRALKSSEELFPQLDHQKRVISKSMNRQIKPGATGPNTQRSRQRRKGSKKATEGQTVDNSTNNNSLNFDRTTQRRKSRTPPLAYRSRNKSESPKPKPLNKKANNKNLNTNTKECCSTDHNSQTNSSLPIDQSQINDNLFQSVKEKSQLQRSNDVENSSDKKELATPSTCCVSKSLTQSPEEKSIKSLPVAGSRCAASKPFHSSKSRSPVSRSVSPDANNQSKRSSRSNSVCSIDKDIMNKSTKTNKYESSSVGSFSVSNEISRRSKSISPLNHIHKKTYTGRNRKSRSPCRKRNRSKSPSYKQTKRYYKYSRSRSNSKSPHRHFSRRKQNDSPSPSRSRKRSVSRSLSRERSLSRKSRDRKRSSSRERRNLMDFMLGKPTALNNKIIKNTASQLIDMMYKVKPPSSNTVPAIVPNNFGLRPGLSHSSNQNQFQNYTPPNPVNVANFGFPSQPCPYVGPSAPFPNTGTQPLVNMPPLGNQNYYAPNWQNAPPPTRNIGPGPNSSFNNPTQPMYNPPTFNQGYHFNNN